MKHYLNPPKSHKYAPDLLPELNNIDKLLQTSRSEKTKRLNISWQNIAGRTPRLFSLYALKHAEMPLSHATFLKEIVTTQVKNTSKNRRLASDIYHMHIGNFLSPEQRLHAEKIIDRRERKKQAINEEKLKRSEKTRVQVSLHHLYI